MCIGLNTFSKSRACSLSSNERNGSSPCLGWAAQSGWIIFRGDKAGGQEHTYPDQAVRPTPSEEFGLFNIDGPGAEAPVYGPSRSTADYTDITKEREWLHPDILKVRELQAERRRKAEEKEKPEEEKPD